MNGFARIDTIFAWTTCARWGLLCESRVGAHARAACLMQGENDCHTVMGNSAAKAGYSCEMQALVAQWRKLWSASPGTTDPLATFGIVTLASSGSEGASSLAMGAMRQAQTAGFGVLPGPSDSPMANTFLAQAYDLDDEWSGDRGPCVATGWNISSPEHECCDNKGFVANTSTCPPTWQDKCANMCTANAGTSQYMGSIHVSLGAMTPLPHTAHSTLTLLAAAAEIQDLRRYPAGQGCVQLGGVIRWESRLHRPNALRLHARRQVTQDRLRPHHAARRQGRAAEIRQAQLHVRRRSTTVCCCCPRASTRQLSP